MLPGGRMFASFDGVDFVRWKAPAELLKLRFVVSMWAMVKIPLKERSYKQTSNVTIGFGCPLSHEAARRVNRTFCRVALDSR